MMVDVSRRDFLKSGVTAAVVSGGSLGAFYFGYEASLEKPVRVGVLGTGDEGSVLIGAINPDYIQVCAIADIRPYSIHRAFHGDWYSEAALKARPGLLAKYGWKTEEEARRHVRVYGDYRELLEAEKGRIEAVIIALPLHLHAPAAIAAMQRGYHVLTEKLMGHTVAQCKEMARVAKLTEKHLATGHQRHYNILYAEAVDTIRRGLLGEIHYIRGQWHRGNLPGNDSWQPPMPEEIKPDDPLAKTLRRQLASWRARLRTAPAKEVELWRKRVAQLEAQLADAVLRDKAEQFGYQHKVIKDHEGRILWNRPAAEELIRWRLWDSTGAGLMAELGSHQLDAASIFIAAAHGGQKQYPLRVVAAAARPIFGADREVESHVVCVIDFPAPGYDPADPLASQKRISVQYASINGNGFGGYGEIVFGTKGTLILEREQVKHLFLEGGSTSMSAGPAAGPMLDTQATMPQQAAAGEGPSYMEVSRGYKEELEHWAWCIRRNPRARDPEIRPRCHPEVALADAVIALVTNMAAREGRPITFQKEWFDPDSDETPEGTKPDISRYA